MKALVPMGVVAVLLASPAAVANGINGINGSMPSRLSMNVTVARQTQGKTFGEKVNAGLHAAGSALSQGASASAINIDCAAESCAIVFPGGDGVRADLAALRLTPLARTERPSMDAPVDRRESTSGGAIAQGASLLGGAMPGAGIVSAAVSSVGGMAHAGGAASASYAATGRALPSAEGNGTAPVDLAQPLAEGDYELAVVVEKATSGLKDTLKTNGRMAAPRQVRIVLGFSVRGGVLKAKHDTAKNSVSNIR